MISLKIVTYEDEAMIKEYLDSFQANGNFVEGNVGMIDHMKFNDWMYVFADSETERTHLILLDDKMVGTLDYRFTNNKKLTKSLGQIGYAIHPEYRNKGYAKEALKIGIKNHPDKIITITCLKENIASAKVIEAAGGILVKEFKFDNEPSLRYQITK